jgi:hypothetical protein
MRTTGKKNNQGVRRATKKTAETSTKSDASATETEDEGTERFAKDLLVRGEAAKPTAGGKLPPQATHAVTQDAEGKVKIKRARFKMF